MEENEGAVLGNDGFFFVVKEDDGYEDLYNNINVGKNEEEEKMGVFQLSSKSSVELQNQVSGVVTSSQEPSPNFSVEESMDENEAVEGGGLGDDHRNEAISDVAGGLGFLIEEEEDDGHEDLHNNINAGKNEEEEKMSLFRLSSKSSVELQNQVSGVVTSSQEPNPMFSVEESIDENEAVEGGGLGDDHRNEAISDVAWGWGFLFEEEEDDGYEDLYNNISVGENFLQNEQEEKVVELRQESSSAAVRAAIVEVKVENEENASSNVVNQEIIQRPTAASAGVLGNAGNVGNSGNDDTVSQGMVSGNATGSMGNFGALGERGGRGGTILFVGRLLWWTTDAEVELELSHYGAVKEVTFFNNKSNGKSKGYCLAEFYEPAAAAACKERMNGHVFNGRACAVTFASPAALRRMEEARLNRINRQNAQWQMAPVNVQARLEPGDTADKPGGNNNNATVGNFQGDGDNNRDLERAGPQRMEDRGQVGSKRNRIDGVVGREIMGNAGGGLGQGIGAASSLIHPQTMMGQLFDPVFRWPMGNAGGGLRQGIGAASSSIHLQTMMGQISDPALRWPMGRMGGYGGLPGGLTPPFSGRLPPFPPVGRVGLPGVAPHVNPAFFGRMPMNSMGMMPRAVMEGPTMGMLSDPNMGRWAGDEHGYRAGGSNEPLSDYQYGEESRDRGAWPSNRENDRGSERDRPDSSDNRYLDDREPSNDIDVARDENRGRDHDGQKRRRQDDRDVGSSRGRDHDHGEAST